MSDSEDSDLTPRGMREKYARENDLPADVQAKLARLAAFEALAVEIQTCGIADCNDPGCRLAALAPKTA